MATSEAIRIERVNGRQPTLRFGLAWDALMLDPAVAVARKGFEPQAITGLRQDPDAANALFRDAVEMADLDALAFYLEGPLAGHQIKGHVGGVQTTGCDGAIAHTGDDRSGAGGGWDEVIVIQLALLPPSIHTLALVVDSVGGQPLAGISSVQATLAYAHSEQTLLKLDRRFGQDETTLLFALIQRQAEDFFVRPVMQGYTGIDGQEGVERMLLAHL